MTYAEKLKNPLWQKKRLEILQRDGFKCMLCGGEKDCLHVHHLYYESGVEIWDHSGDSLITYCEYCHTIAEYLKKQNGLLLPVRVVKCRYKDDISTMLCIVQNVEKNNEELVVVKFLALKIIEGLYFERDLVEKIINLFTPKEE